MTLFSNKAHGYQNNVGLRSMFLKYIAVAPRRDLLARKYVVPQSSDVMEYSGMDVGDSDQLAKINKVVNQAATD